jgi:hypothetical protein
MSAFNSTVRVLAGERDKGNQDQSSRILLTQFFEVHVQRRGETRLKRTIE